MIKGGKQTNKPDDSGSVQKAQVSYLGQINNVPNVTPYGFFCAPPVRSTWILFPLLNNDDNVVGFGNDYINRPELKEGEVCLYNTQTKAKILLNEDGGIEIESFGDVKVNSTGDIDVTCSQASISAVDVSIDSTTASITSSNITMTGTVQINGTLNVTGLVTGLEFTDGTTLYSTHVHFVSTVPSNSSPAITP